jgi:putative membrane protein
MPLNPTDLAAIEAAVRAAELRTTGEIYCVVSEESSDYGETPLAWAAAVALLAPALMLLLGVKVQVPDLFAGGWSAAQVGEAAETAAHVALVGAIVLQGVLFALTVALVAVPPVRRFMTPRGLKRARVRRRAEEQFLGKNLHLTRERTGVLIFVSFAERMAELIADENIAAHVEPHVWDQAMKALTDGLKHGRAGEGFAAAVGLCGDVLAQRFPARPDDNPNELPDAVVVLPRG